MLSLEISFIDLIVTALIAIPVLLYALRTLRATRNKRLVKAVVGGIGTFLVMAVFFFSLVSIFPSLAGIGLWIAFIVLLFVKERMSSKKRLSTKSGASGAVRRPSVEVGSYDTASSVVEEKRSLSRLPEDRVRFVEAKISGDRVPSGEFSNSSLVMSTPTVFRTEGAPRTRQMEHFRSELVIPSSGETTPVPELPETDWCPHGLRHLNRPSKTGTIPDECLTCVKLLQCRYV